MKTRLSGAVLVAVVMTGFVQASDEPQFTQWTRRVTEAYVSRMIDPPDGYAFQFKGVDFWHQCELTKFHTTTVVVRPDLDGTYADSACPRHHDCYCHIFVPDRATALNYQMLIVRYRQGAPPSSDDRVQYRIK